MDQVTSYDDDVYAWAYEQAEVLRRMAGTSRELPNALDIENIAEEIEGVARTELREAESFLRLLLVHLLKIASAPDAPAVEHWRTETDIFHSSFQVTATATILRKLRTDRIWKLALRQAAEQLREGGDALVDGLPSNLPIEPSDLAAETLDVNAIVAAFRPSAAEATRPA